jgi:hypothetical protein
VVRIGSGVMVDDLRKVPQRGSFSGKIVCSEGELIKPFLQSGKIATSEEMN